MTVSFAQYYAILARYLREQKSRFALLVVLVVLAKGLEVGNPQFVRIFIDAAHEGKPLNLLIMLAVAFVAVSIVQQVIAVGSAYLGEVVAWVATNALREDLAAHCLRLDMQFHHEKSPGDLIERIEGDSLDFAVFFSQIVVRAGSNVLMLAGIMVAIFFVHWQLGAAFTICAVASLAGLNAVRNIAVPYQKVMRDADTALFGFLEERLAGTEDIRASGAVGYVLRQLFALQTTIYRAWRKASLTFIFVHLTAGMLLMTAYAATFLLGSHLLHTGAISMGAVYMVLYYAGLMAMPIRQITQQVETLQNIGATIERMSEVLSQQSSIVDGHGGSIAEGAPLALAFADVSFAYHEDKPILHHVSFAVAPGRVLGLLGRTGSGKTTIARLIFRLYDVLHGQGAVRVDGTDIRDVTVETLRHRVAFVTQDVQLFQASVRDNITFFDPTVPDARILEVIEALELGDWFAGLPQGLDTRLQTGGRSLSAGEAQLLAFTRVFLRNPGFVVLDEASSRLDPATEQLVERAITHLLENRSAIIIAHRLGTLHRADDVLVLEDGHVVEYGNREQLLADTASRFYELHQTGLEEVLV
jgi:ATP-binding cassette, subfamily B, bacterial